MWLHHDIIVPFLFLDVRPNRSAFLKWNFASFSIFLLLKLISMVFSKFAGISAALLGVMGSRFKKSGKIFPAGVVSLVSLIMTGGYLHGIMRSLH